MSTAATSQITEQQIVDQYNKMRQDQSQLMSRIAQLDGELHEHSLVTTTLKSMEPTRRCHRLVGGVLIEKPVKDVLPEVEQAMENIAAAVKAFNDQLIKKEREMESFVSQYKINVKSGPAAAASGADSRGVLA